CDTTCVNSDRLDFNRRRFVHCLSALGMGSTLMPEALTIASQDAETITLDMLEAAQKIAGMSFSRGEQQRILQTLNASRGSMAGFRFLRSANLGNVAQPAIVFNSVPFGKRLPIGPRTLVRCDFIVSRPPC